ncbi:hypothetical protein WM008_01120 [Vibrio vulnificus]|uniref:hypothetical protein n=1 Tax=Vibrio vulnificus TaxID=672 RepID=UPI0030EE3CF1
MNELKAYLSSLTMPEKESYAIRAGTTLRYLRKIVSIKRTTIHPKTCALLERESAGQVSRKDLRPDDWFEIWPELAVKEIVREAA